MRIAIGHPFLGRGGSEARVMWLIEALKDGHRVDVVTTGGWDLKELNHAYSTSVQSHEVHIRIPPVARLLGKASAAALRAGIYQRYCRSVAIDYDLCISAYNITDWGAPAIHFIADFCWSKEIRDRFDPQTPGMFYRDSPLRRTYLEIGRLLRRPSGRNPWREDIIIANSVWTAKTLHAMYGRQFQVIYPPVPGMYPIVSWEKKVPDFFCISRIEPEKRIEDAISILSRVRTYGYPVKFHVMGRFPETPYARRLKALCKKNAEWIVLEGAVYGPAKFELLSRFRYGIHTCRREAFGITVAEMVRAGAIPFAPAEGGQAEILGDESLLFHDLDDAVVRIVEVLRSEDRQAKVRHRLAEKGRLFSEGHFVSNIQRLIEAKDV